MNFLGFPVSDSLKEQLSKMEQSRRIPHAIILSGSSNEAREEMATLLSMWAVCKNQDEKPCGVCIQCQKAKGHNHMDIYFAKGKGKTDSISVDEVRNIVKDSIIIPGEASKKIYIFTDADKRMGKEALNAFLKTLEEPTQDTLFILTVESTKTLPQTILSRCAVLSMGSRAEFDKESLSLARDILAGIIDLRELSLLKATSNLSTRQKALDVLPIVRLILSDALALSVGAEPIFDKETAAMLRMKLTKGKIINLIHTTQDAINKINRNLNPTIFGAWLCGEYRRISWQK